ncbi:uncharacterized protein JCM6883_000754 [Sporobolomyces salmoneus]|uniref:uncharacterized protein n=1 Tax=Sporobolomyces salmoneus TaxID=183962 RepID=UPI0031802CDA
MKRRASSPVPTSSSSYQHKRSQQPLPPQESYHQAMSNSGYRGRGRPRGGGARGSSRGGFSAPSSARTPPDLPTAPGPLHSTEYILQSLYPQLTGNPRATVGQKYVENPKGVLANYLKALGEDVTYRTEKKRVDGVSVWRSTIVADPSPPPPQRQYGAPSMPGIIEPVVGTGDSSISAKDAEKLAALEACVRLSARNLFTSSNLPTRTKGQHTPLHTASQPPPSTSGYSNAFNSASSASYGQSSTQLPTPFPPPGSNGATTTTTHTIPPGGGNDGKTVTLSNGQRIDLAEARLFMDFYCKFPLPSLLTFSSLILSSNIDR